MLQLRHLDNRLRSESGGRAEAAEALHAAIEEAGRRVSQHSRLLQERVPSEVFYCRPVGSGSGTKGALLHLCDVMQAALKDRLAAARGGDGGPSVWSHFWRALEQLRCARKPAPRNQRINPRARASAPCSHVSTRARCNKTTAGR